VNVINQNTRTRLSVVKISHKDQRAAAGELNSSCFCLWTINSVSSELHKMPVSTFTLPKFAIMEEVCQRK